jgi:Rieske Fe-S protein
MWAEESEPEPPPIRVLVSRITGVARSRPAGHETKGFADMSELPTRSAVSRRVAITAGAGVAAGLGLLAACGAKNDAGSGGGATTGAAANSGSGSSNTIVALSAITVGQAVAATINGGPAVVARPTDTTAAAFSAICTHMGCTVNVDGAVLNCPCHGSQYNALTGAVTRGPAPRSLEAIPVRVVDGEVMTT